MTSYLYQVHAGWTGERLGNVHADGIQPVLPFSAPPEFQGRDAMWTPEHFFTAALASCFITTFKAIADYSRFEFGNLEVDVEAVLEKGEGGFSFTRATVKPTLTIASALDSERGGRLLEKAERACLISRSLKTQIEMQPRILVKPQVVAPQAAVVL